MDKCHKCTYKFGDKDPAKDNQSIWNKIFDKRSKIECNICHTAFCNKCCCNKGYAPGFQDLKVPVCDSCLGH